MTVFNVLLQYQIFQVYDHHSIIYLLKCNKYEHAIYESDKFVFDFVKFCDLSFMANESFSKYNLRERER